jgi:hypothetical protein
LGEDWGYRTAEPGPAARHLEAFRAESPRSRLLFTTTNAHIVGTINAREHSVDLLDEEQCRKVLSTGSNTPINNLPSEAAEGSLGQSLRRGFVGR